MEENEMSDFLSFDMIAPCELRIKFTSRPVSNLKARGLGNEWFKRSSGIPRILIRPHYKEKDKFHVHLNGYVLTCMISHETSTPGILYYLCIGVEEEDFNSKNKALRYGLCFYFANGIILSYSNQDGGFHYKNGAAVVISFAEKNCTPAVRYIAKTLEEAGIKEPPAPEEFQPTPELSEYLDIARQYSEAAYSIEEQKALMGMPLSYEGISGSEYDRIENTAYRFFTDRIDEENYPSGTKVELKDINDEEVRATVIGAGEEEGKLYTELLFNSQIDLGLIPSSGIITLSFSSVNRDVQIKAIDKIAEGTADAVYMNDVLGDAEPVGFDSVDLSALDRKLKAKKYPPNQSQLDGIYKGISSKDVYLVMGPPGTGKTTVILEWIRYFVREKKMRVLVSSQNNKAVDNVLERIIEEEGIESLRIGNETKVSDSIKPILFESKLEDLRGKIKEATDKHKLSIEEYTLYWTGIDSALSEAKPLYEKKAELEQELLKGANMLNSTLSACETLLAKHNDLEGKIRIRVDKINLLIAKEDAYKTKNAFFKFILKPFSWIRGLRITHGVSAYDREKAELDSTRLSYNSNCTEYLKLFDKIALEAYAPDLETAEEIREAMKDFTADFSKCDRWGIYKITAPEVTDITSSKYYLTLNSRLSAAFARASEFTGELDKWQKTAVDSSNHTLQSIILNQVNLVGATCIGINSQHRFADLKFDVSIIDEAGQIQIHNALVPMSVSGKLIMLGDHKQIPPSADEELCGILDANGIPTELLEKSLFEDMYNRLPDENKTMLDTQYRMPAEIADIISDWFYEGKYKSFEGKRNMESFIPHIAEKPFLIVDTSGSGAKRFERNIPSGDQTLHDNPLEASLAAKITASLADKGYNLDEVGIISGLKAHVELIREELKKNKIPGEKINGLAATLDSYQGQERDIIIYSFGRSSDKSPERNGVGFLTELRRLNVAMSRCKKALIMIGDMKFLSERESVVDYKGEPVLEPEKTEKNFSAFIRHVLTAAENGAGEIISAEELESRLSGREEK